MQIRYSRLPKGLPVPGAACQAGAETKAPCPEVANNPACVSGGVSASLRVIGKRLVMVAGLLILPLTCRQEKASTGEPAFSNPLPVAPLPADPRAVRLRRFFGKLHCPVWNMADDFVQAADDNQLDWRLLPSISVIESGGGKAYRNNNIFGWGNDGLQLFPSLRAGLNLVAFKLGRSPLYRNRDIVGKLHLYNPDETYADRVLDVMTRISPVVDLSSARRLVRRSSEYVYVAN